eukprot:scaffold455_cov207-Chaetoceros_neogracile.AAC.2
MKGEGRRIKMMLQSSFKRREMRERGSEDEVSEFYSAPQEKKKIRREKKREEKRNPSFFNIVDRE